MIILEELFDAIYSDNIYVLVTNMFLFTFILDFVLCMFNIIKGGMKAGK